MLASRVMEDSTCFNALERVHFAFDLGIGHIHLAQVVACLVVGGRCRCDALRVVCGVFGLRVVGGTGLDELPQIALVAAVKLVLKTL
jgi:hypothetical protein